MGDGHQLSDHHAGQRFQIRLSRFVFERNRSVRKYSRDFEKIIMSIYKLSSNVGAPTIFTLAALLLLAIPAVAATSDSVAQVDHTFVQAFEAKNRVALNLMLDADFTWIDSHGLRLSRAQLLENLPALSNADVEGESHTYSDSAVVRANRGRMNVLRIWVKRGTDWRVLLYQEVLQVEKSEPPGGNASVDCVNPCKTIPFQPKTQSEKEAIASWQAVMKAIVDNDPDAYAPLIADEFTATDTYHDRPYTKADRLSQITKQKQSGTHSAPPELLAADMYDFGETVMMLAKEQRPGAKSYLNTRMWVKRDSRWQMLFSFNTRIE
jgi:Domain of unknown function (DUF4440)